MQLMLETDIKRLGAFDTFMTEEKNLTLFTPSKCLMSG